jgi:glutamyl-tRNA reductase
VLVVGLSHRNAPIEVRERIAITPKRVNEALDKVRAVPSIGETVILSTCNRVEVYAVSREDVDERRAAQEITELLGEMGGREVVPHLGSAMGTDAVRHLFRVASSLDSLVVGEPQILGQLKDAIRCAADARTLGPELNVAMRSALQVAKKVRTETAIGEGQVSVPSVAVDLAGRIFEELDGQTALLVGAGEMAESAAKLLAREGASLLVVNRSAERAESLAKTVGGRPAPWDQLEAMLIAADIVVASTASPHPVITKKMLKGLRRKRRGRSLFLIDIAVPRDVESAVNDLDNIYLYDIDDLSHVVAQTLEGRRSEAEKAEALVARETRAFEERRSQQAMKPIIVALRKQVADVLTAELGRSYRNRLKHLSEEDRAALEKMASAAVNKILHAPTKRLKDLATSSRSEEIAELICHLFELEPSVLASIPPVSGREASSSTGDDEEDDEDGEHSGPRVAVR